MTKPQSDQVDEPIEIQPYDPGWPEVFRSEALRIQSQLGNHAMAIEHIGSSAIPGLQGKPVVDIMVGVRSGDLRVDMLRSELNDYDSLGEAGVPGRLYFRKRGTEAVNVHVVEFLGTHWTDNLLLREYLLAHPDEAKRYGRTKIQIVNSGICRLLAYSQSKREIMEELLSNARTWRLEYGTGSDNDA
jgi:GrpB-like predicted nucleotidyltransferase (UPF0157 family)